MGRPKALVELDGEPLVLRALRVLAEGGGAPLVVVLGAGADAVRAVLPAGVRRRGGARLGRRHGRVAARRARRAGGVGPEGRPSTRPSCTWWTFPG